RHELDGHRMVEVPHDDVAPVLPRHGGGDRRGLLRHRDRPYAIELLSPDAYRDVWRGRVPLHAARRPRAEPDVDVVVDHHDPDGKPMLALAGGGGLELERALAGEGGGVPARRNGS